MKCLILWLAICSIYESLLLPAHAQFISLDAPPAAEACPCTCYETGATHVTANCDPIEERSLAELGLAQLNAEGDIVFPDSAATAFGTPVPPCTKRSCYCLKSGGHTAEKNGACGTVASTPTPTPTPPPFECGVCNCPPGFPVPVTNPEYCASTIEWSPGVPNCSSRPCKCHAGANPQQTGWGTCRDKS